MQNEIFYWGNLDEEYRSLYHTENFVKRVYERFTPIKTNDVVLDIGANYGSFSYSVIDKVEKIICVEPDTDCFDGLKVNLADSRATLINKGIYNSQDFQEIIEPLPRIDFLKFDCEGGEQFIFNEHNLESVLHKIIAGAGEWHIAGDGLINTMEKFFYFRDNFLPYYDYKVFDRFDNDYSDLIWDNGRMRELEHYCWWLHSRGEYVGQFLVYLNPKKTHEFDI